jgi:hypothetical protein
MNNGKNLYLKMMTRKANVEAEKKEMIEMRV